MRYLAEKKIIHPLNAKLRKAKRLNRTLPAGFINGYEVIIWEDSLVVLWSLISLIILF